MAATDYAINTNDYPRELEDSPSERPEGGYKAQTRRAMYSFENVEG